MSLSSLGGSHQTGLERETIKIQAAIEFSFILDCQFYFYTLEVDLHRFKLFLLLENFLQLHWSCSSATSVHFTYRQLIKLSAL